MAETLCGIWNEVANSYGSCCLKNSLRKMRDCDLLGHPKHLGHTKLALQLLNPEKNSCPLTTMRARTEPGPRVLRRLTSSQLGNLGLCKVSSSQTESPSWFSFPFPQSVFSDHC